MNKQVKHIVRPKIMNAAENKEVGKGECYSFISRDQRSTH